MMEIFELVFGLILTVWIEVIAVAWYEELTKEEIR